MVRQTSLNETKSRLGSACWGNKLKFGERPLKDKWNKIYYESVRIGGQPESEEDGAEYVWCCKK